MELCSFPKVVDQPMTSLQISTNLGLSSLYGESDISINTIGSPDNCSKDSIIFIKSLNSSDLESKVKNCNAGLILANQYTNIKKNQALLICDDPLAFFIKACSFLFTSNENSSIHTTAVISSEVVISKSVTIGPNTIVENGVYIESNCMIGANCFIGRNTKILKNTIIQNNTTIGSVGLGFHFDRNGNRLFFPHFGAVILGENVIIGSGCVLVRGQLSDTRIETGSRIGNLVNIGHNCTIGENSSISSGTTVAGGAHIGKNCQIGVGVVINSKIVLGDNSIIGMGTVLTKSLPNYSSVFGNPARPLPTMEKF
jgi:UDP-3-O-[3-hydroxymyristoyl] glucosamine N-acyltransferase